MPRVSFGDENVMSQKFLQEDMGDGLVSSDKMGASQNNLTDRQFAIDDLASRYTNVEFRPSTKPSLNGTKDFFNANMPPVVYENN